MVSSRIIPELAIIVETPVAANVAGVGAAKRKRNPNLGKRCYSYCCWIAAGVAVVAAVITTALAGVAVGMAGSCVLRELL